MQYIPSRNKNRNRFTMRKHGFIIVAVMVLIVAGYFGIDTWLTNRQSKTGLPENGINSKAEDNHSKDAEGQDETKVTTSTLSDYTVAPDLPRALYIDKLKIASRIMPMSVNKDGSMQAPLNIYDSGWYTGSAKPGAAGASFIDGHASGPTREGLFAYLDTLTEGDTLQVEKGNGQKLTYKVMHVETIPLEGLDMRKALLPYNSVPKGLNLMTCTGKWLPESKTYDHRVIVYTELVG